MAKGVKQEPEVLRVCFRSIIVPLAMANRRGATKTFNTIR
jgi:hypothetical protein